MHVLKIIGTKALDQQLVLLNLGSALFGGLMTFLSYFSREKLCEWDTVIVKLFQIFRFVCIKGREVVWIELVNNHPTVTLTCKLHKMKLSIFVALATLLSSTQATPVPAEGELNILSARGLPNSQGVSGGFF
jgi:hypothetical protein